MISSTGLPPVLLGPPVELHPGVHGSLVTNPPPGVTYLVGSATHLYGHKHIARWSPFHHPAIDEAVQLQTPQRGAYLVHTSRVPAYGRVPWLADADCLLVTLLWGRDLVFGFGENAENAMDTEQSKARQHNLLKRYLHCSCHGVAFHTDYSRKTAISYIAESGVTEDTEAFAAKTLVVPPAVSPAGPIEPLMRRFTILYMGRHGAPKGSDVAAEVFRTLALKYHEKIRLLWIGEPPKDSLPPSVEICEPFQRSDYLQILDYIDVFFSPTVSESLGMGLIEAGAHGAAVVTTRGPGMEHIGELFADGRDAILIDLDLSANERVRQFVGAIELLIENPLIARQLGDRAKEMAAERLAQRDQLLLDRYQAMAEAPVGRPVPLAGEAFTTIDGNMLESYYQRQLSGRSRNIYVKASRL